MFQDIPIISIFRYTYVQTCTSTGTDKAKGKIKSSFGLIIKSLEKLPSLESFSFRRYLQLRSKEKKRHRCTEQTFGLCGRRRGWDVSREQHRDMYII